VHTLRACAGDAADLAEQITRLSTDESSRQRAFSEMTRYAVTHSWTEMARRTREVYALAVETGKQNQPP